MNFTFIWETAFLILSGILLLRIAGRKSISQMTLAQTVVMISLGTIIVQPIVDKSMWKAIAGAAIFVAAIVIIEYLELKFNAFEKFITGKSKVIIQNGQLNIKTMKRMRLTVDQLEMRLRNNGITKMEDVKFATIEPNGQLGYELTDDAKPLTVGEFRKILNDYLPAMVMKMESSQEPAKPDIFQELNQSTIKDNPKYLQ
ncbi:DUF421 domain-containing protein [Bacillus sp. ISL-35]|uniref:DUF421 domain-containing protein n=1 Tax=Bacillus sp. ISL-35 TaxID=2819122 RepID=UPI001BEAC9D6|nr:DUF421 domain-containing protein [Bacillus sp. ISL-35]MBT2679622.1 DUF421 domain-containing protein [Bacillus sp. ISL-35]MBT2704654.1 DUF421 domain-containing protein [Chryseobacterium sp. ISL-80]